MGWENTTCNSFSCTSSKDASPVKLLAEIYLIHSSAFRFPFFAVLPPNWPYHDNNSTGKDINSHRKFAFQPCKIKRQSNRSFGCRALFYILVMNPILVTQPSKRVYAPIEPPPRSSPGRPATGKSPDLRSTKKHSFKSSLESHHEITSRYFLVDNIDNDSKRSCGGRPLRIEPNGGQTSEYCVYHVRRTCLF
jgi:hypothetical protein